MANSFWQREKGMKKMNSTVFKVWKTIKHWKAFGKGRRRRSSKRLVINWQKFVIKRIIRLCRFEFFDKGEGRHKRIQAVSPLFFWKREKRDTKKIQAVSPWRILFGKGRRE